MCCCLEGLLYMVFFYCHNKMCEFICVIQRSLVQMCWDLCCHLLMAVIDFLSNLVPLCNYKDRQWFKFKTSFPTGTVKYVTLMLYSIRGTRH